MKLHVEVTAEDIRCGRPEEPWSCPIALAIGRALPGSEAAIFGVDGRVLVHGLRVAFPIPREVSDFVKAFDGDEKVAPFSFDLNIDAPEATP